MNSDEALQVSSYNLVQVNELRFSRRTLLKVPSALLAAPFAGASAGRAAISPEAPKRERLLNGWEYYRGNLGGIWDAWRTRKQAAGYFLEWQGVEMPHCFNARDAVDPDHAYYEGPGWYRIILEPKNPYPNGRTLLHFGGAAQKTQVFVDLEKVGEEHIGGYDEFVVDITDAAPRAAVQNDGKVPIAVFCDNSRDLEMIPSDQSDFCIYGGLYRYVDLVYVPALSLERVHIVANVQPGPKATASVRARLYNPENSAEPTELTVRVSAPSGDVIHSSTTRRAPWTGEQEIASLSIQEPQLWSPATPKLYTCEVTLASSHGAMTETERCGLRYVEWLDHGPFKLNGERLPLRGTCRHEDWAGLGGAVPEELARKEMQMIKEMGANCIRLAHYQQPRTILDSCDELGILVWEEIPWCRGGVGGNRYKDQARRMLRNMIDQHRNHPSVILWGLGNENDWPGDFPTFDPAKIREFMSELNAIAHDLDPSRHTVIRRCEFAKDIPDVYSPSIWAGWYSGRYTEYKSACEKAFKQVKHFIHAEWGGDSHARRHSENPNTGLSKIATGHGTAERTGDYLLTGGQPRASRDGDWSETYICDLFDWYLKEQETMPWLTGSLQWLFKDFPTPLRPDNPIPRVNEKGVVERDLTPKEGYHVFQSYWAEKPMAHIYGHTWPIRWGGRGERKWVKVYSNCPAAELFVNGESCGKKTRNSQDFPAAGLRWEVPFREGTNHLKVLAQKDGVTVTDEISFEYQSAKWGGPAKLELRELHRDTNSVTLEARLFDGAGIQCLDARNLVRFEIAGDGTLINNMGTDTASRVVQMYNGRVMITLKPNGGRSFVTVHSEGLPLAYLEVA